ncbi:MAG: gamma-glutamylcyclotransferase [Thermoplasmata archaeon]|nr:gamma-glutamylcyclotransferase [Thermoplasmata archaeon]
MKYLAYGSNMCTGRLRDRVPSCTEPFPARLKGHELRFHKRSVDGSGKADAYSTDDPNDQVWGVVFDIDNSEKPDLDKAEGLNEGYDETEVEVVDYQNIGHKATMYFAEIDYIDPLLKPYSWYKRFVVEGARQHGLPEAYVSELECVESQEDLDEDRNDENRTIPC